jgi:hypothetical protein
MSAFETLDQLGGAALRELFGALTALVWLRDADAGAA